MSITYRIEPTDDYLSIIVRGSYVLTEVNVMIAYSFEEAVRCGVTKIFFDISAVEGEIPLMDRYEFAMFLVQTNAEHQRKGTSRMKVALFGTESNVDPGRFGEMVANNRGVDLFVTTEKNNALVWLGISPEKMAQHEGQRRIFDPDIAK
jgi:hypothetical protein